MVALTEGLFILSVSTTFWAKVKQHVEENVGSPSGWRGCNSSVTFLLTSLRIFSYLLTNRTFHQITNIFVFSETRVLPVLVLVAATFYILVAILFFANKI